MQIWVDADACPKAIKEILFRAAVRSKIITVFVANQSIQTPQSPYLKTKLVLAGFDVADNQIIQNTQSGDLIITADIPLANAVINKGCLVLNPRGELYDKDNIGQRLTIRNFNEELRGSGVNIGGPAKISQKEIQKFANCLDKLLYSKEYKNIVTK